jgi:hypothetical protein
MSLPINPIAALVAKVSEGLTAATNAGKAALPSIATSVEKAELDAKIAFRSGGIGTNSSPFSPGASNNTTLSGLGNQIQSRVGGAVSSLRTLAGSTSNITADISGSLNKLAGGSLATGLQSLAGNISRGAGMLNNILSLTRGANLPSGGELFLKQGAPAIKLTSNYQDDWRVRINTNWDIFDNSIFKKLENSGGVVWPYNPNITVSTKANYTAVDPVHSNYPFAAYKNSAVDDIQISGEFSCETEADAAYWIAATTFFKTATKMFFGTGANAGSPPIICHLSGYGSSIFNNVPVIIKTFSVDLKDDVNYINCNSFGTNTWVPIMSTISVTVQPLYNRRNLRNFSLEAYTSGQLTTPSGVGYI